MADKQKDEKEIRDAPEPQTNGDFATKQTSRFGERQKRGKGNNGTPKAKESEEMPPGSKKKFTAFLARKQEFKPNASLSREVKDTLLSHMVRHLRPREVQNCWPRHKGILPSAYDFA